MVPKAHADNKQNFDNLMKSMIWTANSHQSSSKLDELSFGAGDDSAHYQKRSPGNGLK